MRIIVILLCMMCQHVFAKNEIELTLPSQMDGGHVFYHELLYRALGDAGYTVTISVPQDHIPQKRATKMVESNQLSLTWLIETEKRNQQYVPVKVPLTNGLIGKRVLLIPPQLQNEFNTIRSLKDLQDSGLIAGMGMQWYDVAIWQANQLPVHLEDGEWRALYSKLTPKGDVNYFPRGMTEILGEAAQNPHLAIEQRLLLNYEKDFYFYLSDEAAGYRQILEQALKQAKNSGLIDRLVRKYWQQTYEQIKPDDRVVINLALPEAGSHKQ
ncbi:MULTISPECIES: hypothetical protein [Vibrio]|uniref:hypothetical protein n=1 Tax=Vibrio TaxID=662 RepID=UPI0001B94268|nr:MULTISPECIES: hypothetical protein [Vibrio]EEX31259.1 hypothetical protein VIC_004206 [Vibrio coralliilyticus ATCC BAA-450]MDE3896458.1 hypothetical protein [Vibrio sp. CC007]